MCVGVCQGEKGKKQNPDKGAARTKAQKRDGFSMVGKC